jgi:hypothetical protein
MKEIEKYSEDFFSGIHPLIANDTSNLSEIFMNSNSENGFLIPEAPSSSPSRKSFKRPRIRDKSKSKSSPDRVP